MPRLAPFALALALLICASGAPACAQALSPERESALAPADSFRDCEGCPEMVVLPAGSFTMGSPAGEGGRNSWEGPQHVVGIARPFAVGKLEVTMDQFAAFVRESGYQAGTRCWTFEGSFAERSDRSFRNPGYAQDGTHPAVCLSWNDATAYVNWLQKKTGKGYRLLSEAEWEYAARAVTSPGSGPRFPFGDDETMLCSHGNGLDQTAKTTIRGTGSWTFLPCSDGYAFTAPVGKLTANAFGLHDLIGNAKEWTQDCFLQGKGYENAPNDGAARTTVDCVTRVVRGGSWLGYGRQLRVAFRYRNAPGDRANDIGLRVARTLMGPWPAPAGR